jgi:rubrerythrin
MELSRHLEAKFRAVFIDQSRDPTPFALDTMDKWHCAGCGLRLVIDADGIARCPNCKRTMGEFAYEITELHPHRS